MTAKKQSLVIDCLLKKQNVVTKIGETSKSNSTVTNLEIKNRYIWLYSN